MRSLASERDAVIDRGELGRHVRWLSALGPRIDGSAADLAAANYLREELCAAGAEVEIFEVPVPVIDGLETSLRLTGSAGEQIKCLPNLRPGLTSAEGLTAELVLVGKGFEADFRSLDGGGRIAVCYTDEPFEGSEANRPRYVHDRTQSARGAGCAALVVTQRRDDNLIMTWGLTRELDDIPSVSIGFKDFLRLRERLQRGRVMAHLRVHGKVRQGSADIVVGRLPGATESSDVIVVVGSHHETVPGSPGANDNATGLAAMLELARHFGRKPLQHHDLLLVATGGEESGHWANAAWVAENADFLKASAKGVLVALCFGAGRLAIHTSKWNGMMTDPALNALLVEVGHDLGSEIRSVNSTPFLSDATEYIDHGIPATLLMPDVRDFPYYHTSDDTSERVDINQVQEVAEVLGEAVKRLDTVALLDSVSLGKTSG